MRLTCMRTLCVLGIVTALTSAASAQTIFSDNFNSETQGAPAASLTQWTISGGTIDVIGTGFFDLYPGNGNYVDLDGTSGNAGAITSTSLSLTPGNYTLSFLLGKNGVGSETMTVAVGGVFGTTITDSLGYPTFVPQSFNFTVVSGTTGSIVFDHAGGDNGGYVIDNVVLTRGSGEAVAPEPSAAALLLVGMALGVVRRRRR